MSPKNALLVAATIGVVGMGVYLFIQVRSTPAQADDAHATRQASHIQRPPEQTPDKPATVDVVKPEAPPVPGTTHTTWERPPTPALAGGSDADDRTVNFKADSLMELASKAYDAQDFDQATAIAGKVLSKEPNNIRMLRIMVSANCIQGDATLAQQHYERLPKFDQEQMKARCDRYGVVFKDSP